MKEWFVGRKANFHQNWYESYRHLLRTIDGLTEPSGVRVIRYSRPITTKNDRYVYLGVLANSSAEALQVGKAIFDEAKTRFNVGFGEVYPPSSFDEIEGFLIPTEFPSDGCIPDELPREEEDVTGPFTFYDLPPLSQASADPAPFDRLLTWLSAAGEGRWESFLRVAKALGAVSDLPSARRLYRRLILLGHLDSSRDGRAWSVAPPVLVQAAARPAEAFWCGSRTSALARALPGSFQSDQPAPQPDGFGPSRWCYRHPNAGTDVGLALCTEPPAWQAPAWGGPVAERLAALLPHIDEWSKTLRSDDVLTAPDVAEQWHLASGSFQPQQAFRVEPSGRCSGPTGLYRLTYGEDSGSFQLTVFFDAAAETKRQLLRGEWYGLRFLALRRGGKYLKAMWREEGGGLLAVPYRQRWPLLYERALVLATGLLPRRQPENGLLYYQGIPLALATAVAEPLGVQVETCCEAAV
jgi:hypothetical protein